MLHHKDIADDSLRKAIREGGIVLGGNSRLKIFGRLDCASGMRMKRANRVFFTSEAEAIGLGYRPCGHCLRKKYAIWRQTH